MAGEELEARIRVLEEIEAIKKLKARYCYLADAREFDAWADLFTEDAKGDYGPFGTYEGREAIRKFMKEIAGAVMPFFRHMVHNPLIEVKGKRQPENGISRCLPLMVQKTGQYG